MSTLLRLPDDLREAFKEPMGRVYTDPANLLRDAKTSGDGPVVTVGDVVTYHLHKTDHEPAVAFIDGKTEREAVNDEVGATLAESDAERVNVENPPATLSEALLRALRESLDDGGPTVVFVDGEEDLATLPAIVAAPLGASVVYGQPGQGMVHVPVTEESRAEARDLLARMEGDVDAALAILEG
ncbi:GTP-dependent dephospho-CoA kinase family protein [Halobium salinum]|uniref:GTP-dependent dephospho-CoA kinase n=1 Tax=Halobium salinum TaxID=1364940 RepID=A0ABD5PCD8_9EURY|nr:GTP-dependent dephospho-CoA kinase family protein [Halobium salinum]